MDIFQPELTQRLFYICSPRQVVSVHIETILVIEQWYLHGLANKEKSTTYSKSYLFSEDLRGFAVQPPTSTLKIM